MKKNQTILSTGRRFSTPIIAFCFLLFCLLPFRTLAQFSGGYGIQGYPYLISNATDLTTLQNFVNSGNLMYNAAHYKLTANITWNGGRIGYNNRPFKGNFDGDENTITMGSIAGGSNSYVGFFGQTEDATIKNLYLNGTSVSGNNQVGSLIGEAVGNTTIENVHVKMTGGVWGSGHYIGGLIGATYDTKNKTVGISYCSVDIASLHTSKDASSNNWVSVGGLIGDCNPFTNTTILVTDCYVKAHITAIGISSHNQRQIGGLFGRVASGSTITLTRCVSMFTSNFTNLLSTEHSRGALIGLLNSGAVVTFNTVTTNHSSPSSTIVIGSNSGIANINRIWTGFTHFTENFYHHLERVNNNNGAIASNQRGNEKWGFGHTAYLTKTGYAVAVTRGTGINTITNHNYVSSNVHYVNANRPLTIQPVQIPNSHQRVAYTFTPSYNHSSGEGTTTGSGNNISNNNYTASQSGNNWLLTARVNGTVTASIVNIPYPVTASAIFYQWDSKVTVSWTYTNANNLTGKFYVFRRETAPTSGAWVLMNSAGTNVENGAATKTLALDHTINSGDFNKVFQYCIGFVEGTGAAPSTPDDIPAANKATTFPTSTTPSIGSWNATAIGGTNAITVSFTAPTQLTNSSSYKYDILRSINGGAFSSWISNQSFAGEESYTHVNTSITSPCDYYIYRVVITAFGTTFTRETNQARVTGNTKFTAAEPLKISKGEYANYVRLQWKVDKPSGGSNETYRVFRRVANTNQAFVELETVTSNASTVYWNDNNALNGVYYEYRVTIYQVCTGTETELQSKTDIGFTQAFGTVLGRVTYGTGNAVQGVNMLVRRNDLQGEETQYRSLRSEGGGQEVAFSSQALTNMINTNQYTLQFWLYPDVANTGGTIGAVGKKILKMNKALFSDNYVLYIDGTIPVPKNGLIIPNKFSHITIIRNGNSWQIITVIDEDTDNIYLSKGTFTNDDTWNLFFPEFSFGNNLKGNIDDVRVWNRPLTDEEILNTYSRRLVGNENGLKGYWTFDEGLPGYAFDMSREGTVYNGNHARKNTLTFDTRIPDEHYQLALKGVTDANGNYQINGIPFHGEGTSYSIVPSLGVHQFNPTEQLRYISPNSMVHNNTDFTDISSFEVSGRIVYEGGTYPVAGCSFEIDNVVVTKPNGELVTSEQDGSFTISVPIGVHSVRIVKPGHTFADGGYLKEPVYGTNGEITGYKDLNYNAPIANVKFLDQTRVKLIGRLTGGKTENDKPLGFGESNNNIGTHTLTLNSIRPQYEFVVGDPVTETFTHNQGQWKLNEYEDYENTVTYNEQSINIEINSTTGEFVALLYPEPYNIGNITVPGAGDATLTIYNRNEMLDLTNAVVIPMGSMTEKDLMKTSIRTWIDSTWIDNKPGVVPHWQYEEFSDTVYYHDKWTYYYQSTPTFSVQQYVNGAPIDYFGESTYIFHEGFTGIIDTIVLYNETAQTYLFDLPLFRQGGLYDFYMSAFEEYTNYASSPSETVRYPVKDGTVLMTNTISSSNSETISMGDNGKVVYQFMAGAPNMTTGKNDFYATLWLGSTGYLWNMGTSSPIEVWHLGAVGTGTNFMTAGPDRVSFVLRDPPGSKSKATIESGATLTETFSFELKEGADYAFKYSTQAGSKVETLAGIGILVGTNIEIKNTTTITTTVKEEFSWKTAGQRAVTYNETIETSSSSSHVGHSADVFVGYSTNILFGLANTIAILKNYDDDVFISNGTYSIGKDVSIAFGETFDTRFAFTEKEIEDIMIPKWKNALAILLQPMGTPVNTSYITTPVYVSNLSHGDKNFGKLNTDKGAFGAEASTFEAFDDGPSYTIYFPDNYDMENFVTDSIMYYNNHIDNWVHVLYKNEEQKVKANYDNNYSFGPGVTIKVSESHSKTESDTYNFKFSVTCALSHKFGATLNKLGFEAEHTVRGGLDLIFSDGETIKQDSKIGFTLEDGDPDNEITVDYGIGASGSGYAARYGTFVFKTRGGQTSCPYEGERRTKYYQPGQHILSEGTMQIDVPKLRIASAPHVINVPANKPATFVLAMENESEIGKRITYRLGVNEATNPHGAILKIDGAVLTGEGRSFSVGYGETLLKTLIVEKGSVEDYDLELQFKSSCEGKISDNATIKVNFIPGVSDVAIAEPTPNWILNTDNPTGDTLNVVINNYDINFPNFGYIQLQYRPIASPTWNTVMTFYKSSLYPQAQGLKEDIGTRSQLIYPWKMPDADGAYEIRATVTSVNALPDGTIVDVLSSYTTDAVPGYKDVRRPTSLGAPSPTNGILGIGDELSITFNEDIQTGMLTQNNFTISGILNEQEIAEPNVGIAVSDNYNQYARTEMPIFTGGSFSIEAWFFTFAPFFGESSTLFAFGDAGNNISLGFNTTGHAVLKIGEESYTSTTAIAIDETWKYIAMAYDRDDNTVSVFEFEGATDNLLFNKIPLTAIPPVQGHLIVGNDFTFSNSFMTGISQLHFYGIKREYAAITGDKSKLKSGREYGLIGYWPMDEGEGTVARDKARARHLVLNSTGWYFYPMGYSKITNGTNNYLSIPTSTYPLNIFTDCTLEFWFNIPNATAVGKTLFCNDNCYIKINENGRLELYKKAANFVTGLVDEIFIREFNTGNLMDGGNHHIAISIKRFGNVNVFIDGVNTSVFPESLLGDFSSDYFYFGVKRILNTFSDYFAGSFDEIRIWNSALTRDNILLNKNSKLRGNEAGLQAYYPFETYTRQPNGLITVTPTNINQAITDNLTCEGSAGSQQIDVPLKDVRPVEEVPFTYVASNNKIVFTLAPSYFARVEGTQLNITVSNVRDMRNNKSNTEQWTAFVRRNSLRWDTDPIYQKMEERESKTFTAKIVNTGGTTINYTIENLPSWLSVNYPVGSLAPLANRELTFTISQGINIGSYETGIGLTSGNGVTEILPVQVKVTGQRPNWNVNPANYEFNMNITGQITIEGIFQEDENDLLGAFIGDECVGVVSPVYVSQLNAYYTFLTVYGNSVHTGQTITFKLWDASTGNIYSVIESKISGVLQNITFVANSIKGNLATPVIHNALDIIEQTLNLVNGWNWISVNVTNSNPTIVQQFRDRIGSIGELLKGQISFIQAPMWFGSLTAINKESMYMLKTNAAGSIRFDGKAANPATSPISIVGGWNWLGYIPQFTLPVNEALAGLNAQFGDLIKGQTGYRMYMEPIGWIGSLNYMRAGEGYMYFSEATTPKTFNYPSTASQTYGVMAPPDTIENRWTVDVHKYPGNMTVTSIVLQDNVELQEGIIEIAAFAGEECRGTIKMMHVPYDIEHTFMGFLLVFGESNERITFKVYDHTTGMEYLAQQQMNFVADAIHGTFDQPYIISFETSAVGIEDINVNNTAITLYPNPVTDLLHISYTTDKIDLINITDVVGRTILSKQDFVEKTIDMAGLVQGVYFLSATINGETTIHKLIKK